MIVSQSAVGVPKYRLRGFVARRSGARFVGVCLRPNLVLEGPTSAEGFARLQDVADAYYTDALRDGPVDRFMKLRCSFRFSLEWLCGRLFLSCVYRPDAGAVSPANLR